MILLLAAVRWILAGANPRWTSRFMPVQFGRILPVDAVIDY
jgi:hypothetical protein